jgi:hypothetical protein
MGRGDNRKTKKVRQRAAQRKLKERIKKAKAAGKAKK